MATAIVTTLVCAAVSLLFLLFAGYKENDSVMAQAVSAWDRVVPLIREGPLPPTLVDNHVKAVQVVDARGHVVAASPQLLGKAPMATFHADRANVRAERVLCPPAGLKECENVLSFKVYQPGGFWVLYLAIPVVAWYGSAQSIFVAVGVSLLVITVITSWTFRDLTKALAPVNAIRSRMAEITASGLDRRVPVSEKYEEIRLLAETVNATLDRLEVAYQQLRRFTQDASHDLRTPITAMRAQLEEALMHPDHTDWPTMSTEVLAGVERLQAIVTDLLTLARLDARAPLDRSPTDLGALVDGELKRRNAGKELVGDLTPNVRVDCDRLRIMRVLGNLLDNAERHAISRIAVTVRRDGPAAVLEVLDDGAGIAPEHREIVFDRFTRLDASRARDAGGTGLGLAIAREIAEAHGGTLTIEDSERGARFVLRVPSV
ncbi:sensor histidine kinase [Herbidospora mongoliensis]|uniref:sensor histidine kinase n=1 Tax=Herbidospora mongoliensis TaxID=688067 RepID=UPI000ACE78B9|nr:ATP-binding protein [Herbidospora mongoliensis]